MAAASWGMVWLLVEIVRAVLEGVSMNSAPATRQPREDRRKKIDQHMRAKNVVNSTLSRPIITTTRATRLDDLTDDAWHVIGTSTKPGVWRYFLPEFEVGQMRVQRNHREIETVQRLDSVGCFSLLAKLAKPAVRRFR